ncbi:MBL fold metallo-hydrolase [Cochleicola gelatinilyticus]|uniref:MBL fold metallo-hydrolase n=1 Tax=Cochleicola gelatinilyticus TaxID=1763537 RepID=A0A167HI13_9FLAO|nr:MBL fold metallo-hydrolase [Cochleicola gelatinilyticus]OAB78629.1 MBL fold metallo-hydrolase [Cochleicola gelatinilyticus]
MKKVLYFAAVALMLLGCNSKKDKNASENDDVATVTSDTEDTSMEVADFNITPISHATMVLEWEGKTIYVDPVGGAEAFAGMESPDLILISDIHGDHLNAETVTAVIADGTGIIAPKAVADKLPEELQSVTTILNNGANTNMKGFDGFTFEAIPMYNLREEALKFHEKGRGNGYIIEKDGMRVYISGDTEDIPEMRNLNDIDVAFVCMNLPYTMTVESAADGVLAFKPAKIYPYHYRGTDGLSDVSKFKELVNNGDTNIEVIQLDWYPEKE